MLKIIEGRLMSVSFIVAFVVCLWLAAWFANGYAGTKFDLMALRDMLVFVLSKYGIDSWLNTKREEFPK